MYFKVIALVAVLFGVAVAVPVGSSISGLIAEPVGVRSYHNNGRVGIYGGHNITINKANYVGAILDTSSDLLGTAVILNNRWIVTAAYNFYDITEEDVKIKVGSTVLATQGTLINVHKIFRHPKYAGYWDYDIALAKLATPLKFSGKIGSTSVSGAKLPKNGAIGVVSGYGWTETSVGGFLQQTSDPVSNYNTCKSRCPSFFSSLSFCTAKDGSGPCAYDFGSPLIYKNKVIGIFSGTFGCGSSQTPSVYADVSQYKKWLDETIRKNTEEGEVLEYSEQTEEDEE